MISRLFLLPALLLALVSAGCAPLQPVPAATPPATYEQHAERVAQIRAFALNGRIGVLSEKKGFSGTLHWHHHTEGDDIDFYSPIGTQLGSISAGADGVTLTTSDQKTYTAQDAETLMQDTLGWSLPMAGLSNWVLGRPSAGEVQILAWDGQGRILHMRQNGWDIEYPHYMEAEGQQLPGKIVLKSQKLDLKLVIEQWVGIQAEE
ncbi:outer-membrane lipoprotein LolB precursor [mine drainage metagenome]|uniref:Outer-membrane lipoprotein LolB n=1 Tax=mine drainage metagenome TaxID=410659 RepID=A0A1J5Q4A7_9ZZZZ